MTVQSLQLSNTADTSHASKKFYPYLKAPRYMIHFCHIGLGANLAHQQRTPSASILQSIALLKALNVDVRLVSRLFKTPAFPAGSGPDYVNAVAEIATELTPSEILAVLHDVEAQMGRERRERWGARVCDLDLLTYDDLVLPERSVQDAWRKMPLDVQMRRAPDELILPHPRMQDRSFVLIPMRDIAPNWRHPITGLSVLQMVATLRREDVEAITVIKGIP